MNQILRIIQLGSYLGGIIGLAGGVIVKLAGITVTSARAGFELAAACFLCAIASARIAASLKPAEEQEEAKAKAAAA
ncbi:MAG: hypothetical protein NTZ98_05880 [Acidobacteria bacterium]|jgi:hypothetical protein|nr:hypothetical protein [Acidobacteriota bacterium]